MIYTNDQIITIHRKASAVEGKKYYNKVGDVYLGLDNGRLKKLDSNELEQSSNIDSNTTELVNVNKELDALETKHDSDILKLKCYSLAMAIVL